jgi:RNA polymerase sigma factor (sigma-70 family)
MVGMTRADRYRQLYTEHFRAVLGFAARRTEDWADAADVAAETLTVAWRRLDDVPNGDAARWWLYAVARRVLANQNRGQRRHERLVGKLGAVIENSVVPFYDDGSNRELRAAVARLDEDDRELLLLTVWEGLSPAEAAAVLGINPVTARTRLHRARSKLRTMLIAGGVDDRVPNSGAEHLAESGHVQVTTTQPSHPEEGIR